MDQTAHIQAVVGGSHFCLLLFTLSAVQSNCNNGYEMLAMG